MDDHPVTVQRVVKSVKIDFDDGQSVTVRRLHLVKGDPPVQSTVVELEFYAVFWKDGVKGKAETFRKSMNNEDRRTIGAAFNSILAFAEKTAFRPPPGTELSAPALDWLSIGNTVPTKDISNVGSLIEVRSESLGIAKLTSASEERIVAFRNEFSGQD